MADIESRSLLPRGLRWAGPLLAPFYGFGVRVHRALSKPKFAPIATICVGNLTTGGTGENARGNFLARELAARGRKPAILMRGYKAQGSDEAAEVQAALAGLGIPILLGADRHASALQARELGRDVALLDDGFQHWRLARDLDIVLIDATDPFGGGLIPKGHLREPASGLKRAGVVIITRAELAKAGSCDKFLRHEALSPDAVLLYSRHSPTHLRSLSPGNSEPIALERLRGIRVVAACGIANPAAFKHTLESLGALIVRMKAFDDHHVYTAEDITGLAARVSRFDGQAVVVTEKDAVKIQALALPERVEFFAVGIEFKISEPQNLWPRVEAALQKGDARAAAK